jgi:phosphatidylserine/phosphatidylglycerophosphate/cardiolipin synthase-like enzyme
MRPPALLLALVAFLFSAGSCQASDLTLRDAQVSVHFSPNGGAQDAIVSAINKAQSSVRVLAYNFTNKPIAKALLDAHKRGVKVEVVLDKSQRDEKYTGGRFLDNARVPVFIDAEHAIMHNKVMIIDETTVITGSFNFTRGAEEKNAENVLVISSKELAAVYLENWRLHRGHSEKF